MSLVKWLPLPLILLIVHVSCQEKLHDIQKVIGKKVEMKGLNEIKYLNQVITYNEFRRKYNYVSVIYVDQECGLCKTTVIEWQKQKELLSEFSDKVAFLFIYRGDKPGVFFKELSVFYENMPEDDKFHFFIAPDPDFSFVSNNKDLPHTVTDASFLINGEDRILLVGPPYVTRKMFDLYKKVLSE